MCLRLVAFHKHWTVCAYETMQRVSRGFDMVKHLKALPGDSWGVCLGGFSCFHPPRVCLYHFVQSKSFGNLEERYKKFHCTNNVTTNLQ